MLRSSLPNRCFVGMFIHTSVSFLVVKARAGGNEALRKRCALLIRVSRQCTQQTPS